MAEQNQPASNELAPDTARVYERARPEKEAGTGHMETNKETTTKSADAMLGAISNVQNPEHQINAHDVVDTQARRELSATPAAVQPDHSMLDEEPLGWDLAPQDISNPRDKRHPKTDGKGGTP